MVWSDDEAPDCTWEEIVEPQKVVPAVAEKPRKEQPVKQMPVEVPEKTREELVQIVKDSDFENTLNLFGLEREKPAAEPVVSMAPAREKLPTKKSMPAVPKTTLAKKKTTRPALNAAPAKGGRFSIDDEMYDSYDDNFC
eukprot:GHVN01098509.1.p4 GENE.GHVN01098509.1~~GHVN01098509.1.p4  ORF type:complete len:139 (+),score=26.29 GHVN01098509.1:1070-1486(+)